MKRTSKNALFAIVAGGLCCPAQEPAPPPAPAPQADPIAAILAKVKAAEAAARSFHVELTTRGALEDGLEFTTSGSLHVLRGTHPRQKTVLRFEFGNGLGGVMETVRTKDGITIYQDDPAFGELLLQVAPATVADLEWAGTVLARSDLPGMRDALAEAPLGSGLLEDLRVHFDLAVGKPAEVGGVPGTWLVGARRPGLGDQDPELPIATRVEVFVRSADHAVLEVVHHRGDKVLQRIGVQRLEVDVAIPDEVFAIDARGLKPRDVATYPPLWEQIERALAAAEAKAGEGVVRPSRRER